MELSKTVQRALRKIVREENEAWQNDIKEIYFMISSMNKEQKAIKRDISSISTNISFIASHLNLILPSNK